MGNTWFDDEETSTDKEKLIVKPLKSKKPLEKKSSRRKGSRPFSQEFSVSSPVPLDVGTRDAAVKAVGPQNLGVRNKSAPPVHRKGKRESMRRKATVDFDQEGRVGVMGVSVRRKRESFHRAKTNADAYLMRRYSFMRKTTRSQADDEGNSIGKFATQVKLDAEEIAAIADASHDDLLHHGYNLAQWENVYKQLCRIYDTMHNPRNLDAETINSDESDIKKPFLNVSKWTIERALDKISKVIEGNGEYQSQQKKKWILWEEENEMKNTVALRQMQAFVPVDIKFLSAKDIVEQHGRSWPLAKRLVEKKVFHVIHMTDEEVAKIHNSDFGVKGRFDYTCLDLIELRAVYFSTKGLEKAKWRLGMRQFLYEYTVREKAGTLSKYTKRHHAYSYRPNKKRMSAYRNGMETKKEQLTTALRAKTRCFLYELESKSAERKKAVLSRVERITGSKNNRYTRMVRRKLSLGDSDYNSELDSDDESSDDEEVTDLAQEFDNFYVRGSFNAPKKAESDSDMDEMESIEQLILELRARVTSAEELEALLASVLE